MAVNSKGLVPEDVTSVVQLASEDLVKFLTGLPQVSRPFIETWFCQNPKTMKKPDQSPVTIADKQIETALSNVIAKVFPDDAIQGEEFGAAGNDESALLLGRDPIDGTKAFISGKPIFRHIDWCCRSWCSMCRYD